MKPIVNDHRCAMVNHHETVRLAARLLGQWLKTIPLSMSGLALAAQSEQVEADLRLALQQCQRSHARRARVHTEAVS